MSSNFLYLLNCFTIVFAILDYRAALIDNGRIISLNVVHMLRRLYTHNVNLNIVM